MGGHMDILRDSVAQRVVSVQAQVSGGGTGWGWGVGWFGEGRKGGRLGGMKEDGGGDR